MNDLLGLINIFRSQISFNKDNIKRILDEHGLSSDVSLQLYDEYLKKGMTLLTSKWINGNKYIRTFFVYDILGNDYPEEVLPLSLYIDAIINLLDDLLDENLSQNEKTTYILELLRAISISYNLLGDLNNSRGILKKLSEYYNELISLALAEKVFLQKMKRTENLGKWCKYLVKMLEIRSTDIDIFVFIPLLYKYSDDLDRISISIFLKAFRIYRALNILKKDIYDINHDLETGQETAVTFLRSKGVLESAVQKSVEYLFNRILELEKGVSDNSIVKSKLEILKKVIQEEIDQINSIEK